MITYDIHVRVVPTLVSDLNQITQDAQDMRQMTNAAMFQAEEVLHHSDELIVIEKEASRRQIAETDETVAQLRDTLAHIDASQANVEKSVTSALAPVAPLLDQTSSTLSEAERLEEQMQENLKILEPAETHVNTITANLAATTGDLAKITANATKKKPWWKRIPSDIFTAAKIASLFW